MTAALERYTEPEDARARCREEHRRRRHDEELGMWRRCTRCGSAFAREKEIAIMTKALQRHGLPATHLDTFPDCGDLA